MYILFTIDFRGFWDIAAADTAFDDGDDSDNFEASVSCMKLSFHVHECCLIFHFFLL